MIRVAIVDDHSMVAEGIEVQDEFSTLVRLRCDLFQGYYISRPKADLIVPQLC